MNILLITYYWYPYNNPGAFRWLGFGKYLKFDVLTCNKPINGIKDITMPNINKVVFKFGNKLPAILWGALSIIPVLFLKYDIYIITSPPESLLFTAWILQILKKNVIIDMRDRIVRPTQPHSRLTTIYQWFYNKIKHVIVSAKIIDSSKIIVYHGYDDIERNIRALDPPVYYNYHVNYETYILLLQYGFIKDFSAKIEKRGASSLHTIKHLGYKSNKNMLDEEYGVHSWKEGASIISKLIINIQNEING
jgi:hypothetical protein